MVRFLLSYSNFYESPRGMILRRVNLPGVSYPGKSNDFSRYYLKGQSNKSFFHSSSLSRPMSNGLKYVRILSRFCRFIRIFRRNLPGVSYCAESISPGYHTPGSHSWPRESTAISYNFCTGLGTVSQKQLWIYILLLKGYIFHFLLKMLGSTFFWLPGESVFANLKIE